jgi:hypothetical protein
MIQTYLVDALVFCSILLVIALIVGAIQLVMILVDARKMTHEVKEKFMAISSVLDIVSIILGGLGMVKKKIRVPDSSSLTAFMAGLKKALQVLFKKEGK